MAQRWPNSLALPNRQLIGRDEVMLGDGSFSPHGTCTRNKCAISAATPPTTRVGSQRWTDDQRRTHSLSVHSAACRHVPVRYRRSAIEPSSTTRNVTTTLAAIQISQTLEATASLIP